MNHRPSHAQQQQQIDDALAALPGKRWAWLVTPDPRWLNTVNVDALRTVNAIRMYIGVTVLWAIMMIAVVWKALNRCGDLADIALAERESVAKTILLCEESMATARLFDFAAGLFDSYALLLAGMAGIAAAALIGKRLTDTEHVERKERAKKAPQIVAPIVTGEHVAQPPSQQTTVNVGEDAITAANGERRHPKGGDGPGDDERVD